MNKTLILVVEDDRPIRNLIVTTLKTHDYKYLAAENGFSAILEASSHNPDIVLLDLGLPDMEGVEVIKKIRTWSNMPIIVISARSEDMDKIEALDAGADDYITKPFSPKELVLRVNNIIKRAYRDDNNRISIDGYELDEEQRKIYADNVEIELTTKEFDLLMMFIKNKGIAFSRDKILENVWDENYFGSDRVVDDTLRRLRKKLPNLNIHTIYGYGYRLG